MKLVPERIFLCCFRPDICHQFRQTANDRPSFRAYKNCIHNYYYSLKAYSMCAHAHTCACLYVYMCMRLHCVCVCIVCACAHCVCMCVYVYSCSVCVCACVHACVFALCACVGSIGGRVVVRSIPSSAGISSITPPPSMLSCKMGT